MKMTPQITWHRANPLDTYPFAIVTVDGREVGTVKRRHGRGDLRTDGMWHGYGADGAVTPPDAYPERAARDLAQERWMIPPASQRSW